MIPDQRLSRALSGVAKTLERVLRAALGWADDARVPFLLIVAPEKEAQYVASVSRADGVALMRGLLSRWNDKSQLPDLPPHQKEELILELLAICKAADEQITMVHAALGAPGDYGYESREGRALYELYKFQVGYRATIAKTEEALAFSRALSAEGVISPPPAAEH